VGVGEGLGLGVGVGRDVGAGFGVPVGPGRGVAVGPGFGVPVGPGFGVAVTTLAVGLTVGVLVGFELNTWGCVAKKAPARTAIIMTARMVGSSQRRLESRSGGGGVVVVVAMVFPSGRMYAAWGYPSSKLNE
jgi:hypothetical protein